MEDALSLQEPYMVLRAGVHLCASACFCMLVIRYTSWVTNS